MIGSIKSRLIMEKNFDPKAIESKWQQQYQKRNIGAPSGKGSPYCIMIPPPNVTGQLHMGHGFQLSLMDTMIRYNRMKGNNTLWQMGTDHAGIATQMLVERQCAANGETKEQLGREEFIEKIWQWKQHSGNKISDQIKRLGASVDWQRERFTLDPQLSESVTTAFVKLYREQLLYKGQKLVNWDPVLQTAISDLEVENQEVNGHLWYIKYPIANSKEFITVATTRPETMFGDTAIAVSPNDARYTQYIGKKVKLPLTEREIPIIKDEHITAEFGTGCVKVTPAHDFNDYEIGKRHKLEFRNILNKDGSLNDKVPEEFRNDDRSTARKKILAALKDMNLLVKTTEHTMTIPIGDRSGAIIEPMLTEQWFVKMEKLAEPALAAVKNEEIKFHPKNWENTYNSWLENIQDWCVSRQLWWGHRIPAWYDESNNVYVGKNENEVRSYYQLANTVTLRQDEDVLDTWFSSALWPFATLGWPEKTIDLATFFPTQLLVTGFDIIFFWVARMIMMSLKFTGKIPFKDIYITGLIRDFQGQKMSKSKGNILDPIDLIDGATLEELIDKRTKSLMQPDMHEKVVTATKKEFPAGIVANGTDAVRFTFAALATPGRDIRFDNQRLIGYRNFCNKIWNASRYIKLNVEANQQAVSTIKHPINKWLSSSLNKAITTVAYNLNTFRFDLYAQTLYELVWHEYCDWYLELSKPMLQSKKPEIINETKYVLQQSLIAILKICHPIIPFITEEIYQQCKEDNENELLTTSPYPSSAEWNCYDNAFSQVSVLKQIISSIRNIRSEMNIMPGKKIIVIFAKGSEDDKEIVTEFSDVLLKIAKIDSVRWHNEQEPLPESATAILGQLELHIPLAGLIDYADELNRLNKKIAKLEKNLTAANARLNNSNYIKNAPKDVVTKEQKNKSSWQHELDKLKQQQQLLATKQ